MAEVPRYRFTVEEYERMGATGILTKDDRVELIAGEIVTKPMIGPRHAEGVRRCNRALVLHFGDAAEVSPQNPIRMPSTQSEPEPDLALLKKHPQGYGERHPGPGDVLLLVEVADTSRRTDRERKLPLYAAEGIPETWLVDVDLRRLEVYRNPGPSGYAKVAIFQPGSTTSALAFPETTLAVDDLLP